MAPTPVSLQNLCLIYIIRFLELFPLDYLALLPVAVCQRLLENLPPVDVCRLEQSKFSEGLDIDGVWKKLSDISPILMLCTHHSNTPASHLTKNGYKDSFFSQIYSFLSTKRFEASLAEDRCKIAQCLCIPLRPQTLIQLFHNAPTLTPSANEQQHYWSLLDGNQKLPILTPNRYLPYYQPLPPSLSEKDSIKSIVLLVPTLCKYYPTALDINTNGIFNTVLGKLQRFTDDSTLTKRLFQQVEDLSSALCFTNESQNYHASPDIEKQCQRCIQTILPHARRVLKKFVIRANSQEALGYMLECCIPILQDTLQTPQQSPRCTLIPSLCEVTVALIYNVSINFSPLSEQHGRLLQHLILYYLLWNTVKFIYDHSSVQ